jgi:hypothetical protein
VRKKERMEHAMAMEIETKEGIGDDGDGEIIF